MLAHSTINKRFPIWWLLWKRHNCLLRSQQLKTRSLICWRLIRHKLLAQVFSFVDVNSGKIGEDEASRSFSSSTHSHHKRCKRLKMSQIRFYSLQCPIFWTCCLPHKNVPSGQKVWGLLAWNFVGSYYLQRPACIFCDLGMGLLPARWNWLPIFISPWGS